MTRFLYGDRIGKTAEIMLGCSAVILQEGRQGILLTKRKDNAQWCLPGGRIEPGESVLEACTREVFEETGLSVEVLRLIGLYSDPHCIVEYQDGNKFQVIALNFEARVVGGGLRTSSETISTRYFSKEEVEKLDILDIHRQRISDVFDYQESPFLR